MSLRTLQAMKDDGRKIVGVVAWDYQMARLADRAGVDLVSVGDTVGVNLWGHTNPFEVTLEQMLTVTQAVRRGVQRALVCADFPFGPLQEGADSAVRAAIRFVKEAGVDMVKLDAASDHLDAVEAVTRAGIPVFAQFGITPQTALRFGVEYKAVPTAADAVPVELADALVAEAKSLEAAGAALLNFTNSGPVVGAAVAAAVTVTSARARNRVDRTGADDKAIERIPRSGVDGRIQGRCADHRRRGTSASPDGAGATGGTNG